MTSFFTATSLKDESKTPLTGKLQNMEKIKSLLMSGSLLATVKLTAAKLAELKVGIYLGFDINATIAQVLPWLENNDAAMLGHVVMMMYYQEIAGGNIDLLKVGKLTGKEELKAAIAALKLQKKDGNSIGPEVLTLTRLTAVFHPWAITIRAELGLGPVADVVAPGFEGDGMFNSPDAAYLISTEKEYDSLWSYYINFWAKPHHDKVRKKTRVPLLEFNENIQNAKRAGSFISKEMQVAQSASWLAKLPKVTFQSTPLSSIFASSSKIAAGSPPKK